MADKMSRRSKTLMPSHAQLPLRLSLSTRQTFDNFLPGRNAAAKTALCNLAESGGPAVFLWGGTHTGKSHLLRAAVQHKRHRGEQATIVPASLLLDPSHIELIDTFMFLSIDDVHHLAGNRQGEERLFEWINRLRETGTDFALASQIAPNDPKWQLPDLVSRLNWGYVWRLQEANRDEALAIFVDKACQRGLKLERPVMTWLQRRLPGDLKFLLQLLDNIDAASLSTRRKVTVPLLKSLL